MNPVDPLAEHLGEQKRIRAGRVTLTVVETAPPTNHIGWHYHERPYFTFILRGSVIEGTKNETHTCSTGDLLFHNAFEPHYNTQLTERVRALHLDFDAIDCDRVNVANPATKLLCYQLFREAMIGDDVSPVAMEALSLNLLHGDGGDKRPVWANRLEEILRSDYSEPLSLDGLSRQLHVHPVHISKSFPKYFRCTLGDYIRHVRVERSLAFMSNEKVSLTDIAFACGFADQSHFARSFKQLLGVTPSVYRRLLR